MAKKKAGGSRRKKRTPEEMIRDLQAQIEEVKQRAQARELKDSPAMTRTITVMRGINKALDEASREKNTALQHALAEARRPIADYMESQGLKPPKTRPPRGRKPRA